MSDINFKTGWLKDPADNQKFAPKTTTNQVLTGDGERLTDKLAEIETEAAKHANRLTSNTFSGEQRMAFPGHCSTVHDIASGIGCSLKNARALDNQMIVGEVYAPYTSATDEAMGMQVVKDEIPFYAIDSTEKPEGSSSQKLNKTLLGKITRKGFEGNAATATSATKATQDSDGFVFKEKYETITNVTSHIENPNVHINDTDRSNINYAVSNVTNIISGALKVPNAANADKATTAGLATNAQQDANGRNIVGTYETKTDADTKLTEAKTYADTLQINQLHGTKAITSGSAEDRIWHVCDWTVSASYAGAGINWSIVDSETSFSGILSTKFRNQDTAESHVQWIAASKKPPKAFITKELSEDRTTATYRLYINYHSTWSTPTITKLHETIAGDIASEVINHQVTEADVLGEVLFASESVKVQEAAYAIQALNANNDENGANIVGTYETKIESNNKLIEAQKYADKIKSDLLNGAGAAFDTLKELGDLITENEDAIKALEIVATEKADKNHTHDTYETKTDAAAKLNEAKNYTDTLKNNLTTGSVMPLKAGRADYAERDNNGNVINTTYETKADANSKLSQVQTELANKANLDAIEKLTDDIYEQVNKEVEKVTPFIARYNQTSFSEIKAAHDSGKPIQIKTIDTDKTTTYINQLISVNDNQFIFRGHNDKGDIEYICNQNGWSTRNIQVIKLGDAMFKYDYENKRIVLSFLGEGVE